MTFEMLHKYEKKIKKHIVKADLTRCGHKKYYKKPQLKHVTRCSGTSQLFSIDVINATSYLSFVVASNNWMSYFCSWALAKKYGV
jgi:hypothetical protein